MAEKKKRKQRTAADFTRPDGSFDNDAFLTSTDWMPGEEEAIMRERGFRSNKSRTGGAGGYTGPKPRDPNRIAKMFGALPQAGGVERLDGSTPSMDFTNDPSAIARGDVSNPNDLSDDPLAKEAGDLTPREPKFGAESVELSDAQRDYSNDVGAEMVGDTRPVRDLLAEARKPKFDVGEVQLEDAPPLKEWAEIGEIQRTDKDGWSTIPGLPGLKTRQLNPNDLSDDPRALAAGDVTGQLHDIPGLPGIKGRQLTPESAALEELAGASPKPGPFDQRNPGYVSFSQTAGAGPFNRTVLGYTSTGSQSMRLPPMELPTQPPAPPPVAKRRPAAPPRGPESITDPTIRGAVEGTSKALDDTLARYYAKKAGAAGAPAVAQSGPTSAGGTAPTPATPAQRGPLKGGLESMLLGASPPDTSREEAELEAARKSRESDLFAAQIASQFGRYADIQGGTSTGDRGAALREAASRHEADFAAKKALREQARKQSIEGEDRAFQREGLLEQRRFAIEDRKQKADYADGASDVSKRRRAQAVALYPSVVARVPPAVWNTMSAADIDAFFKEVAPEKTTAVKGSGGGGLGVSTAQMNAIRNKLPQHLVDVYNGIQRVKGLVGSSGGWGAQKAGIAGGMIPSVFMDENTRAVRQELGGVVARFLQAGGGKSITANEERVLIGRIAADPTSSNLRPEDLERGLAIIERSMAGSTRQALAGVPDPAKEALYGDLQIPRSWAEQNLAAPMGGGAQRKIVRNKKTGERRYVNPDGTLGEAAP